MKITVVNSPHVSCDRVRKVLLEYGGSVTFPLLRHFELDGILKGKTTDSFALGTSVSRFVKEQDLSDNHDKASLLRLLERLTDVDHVPFVEKGNPDKEVPASVTNEKMKFSTSDSESTGTSDRK